MTLHIFHPPGRIPERQYIYGVLLKEFLGLDFVTTVHDSPVVEVHCPETPGRKIVLPDQFFSIAENAWLTPASLPAGPLQKYSSENGDRIPILYGQSDNVVQSGSRSEELHLSVDVFGSAFFMLTRYEEIVTATRDRYDRFPYSASIAAREDFARTPIVNEYLELLWSSLVRLWPTLIRRKREFRVFVSHDVDLISQVGLSALTLFRSVAADLFLRRQPSLGLSRIGAHLVARATGAPSPNDPYDSFDWIMATSEACGLRSTFNFVAQPQKSSLDPAYDLDDVFVRALLQRIAARKHEIGFHSGFDTYRDEESTVTGFRRLHETVEDLGITQTTWGGRQHYLRWANPLTWTNWEAAGLHYDSTLMFPETIGFRCGCCYEFPVFDLLGRRELRLRERPTQIMDVTLLSYMNLSRAAAERDATALIQTVRRFSGDFVLLWHNHFLVGDNTRRLYAHVLAEATGCSPCSLQLA